MWFKCYYKIEINFSNIKKGAIKMKFNGEPLGLVVPHGADINLMDASMFYIPKDWIKNKDNEPKIHEILNKHLYTDINVDVSSAIKGLKGIGETIIIERLRDGTIVIH